MTKMESVKLALMKRIKEAMPEAYIDEDYGQLESQDDQYPIVFPCVLISAGDTEWKSMANQPSIQRGHASVKLKLAINCYDDTHIGSTTEDKIDEREQKVGRLVKAIQGVRVSSRTTALDRQHSSDYTLGGGIKVYEETFEYYVQVAL